MKTIPENILSSFIEAVSATSGKWQDAGSRLAEVFQKMSGLTDSDRAAVLDDLTRWMVAKNLIAAEDAAKSSEKTELILFRSGLLRPKWWL